jgi:hypothetical protein
MLMKLRKGYLGMTNRVGNLDNSRNKKIDAPPTRGREVFVKMSMPTLLTSAGTLIDEPRTGKYIAVGLLAAYTLPVLFRKSMGYVALSVGSANALNNISMVVSPFGFNVMSLGAIFLSTKKEVRSSALMAGVLAMTFNSVITSVVLEVDRLSLLNDCKKGVEVRREGFECPKIEPPKSDMIPR